MRGNALRGEYWIKPMSERPYTMKKRDSKRCTGHRALPGNQPAESLEHLGDEWDFWWPVPRALSENQPAEPLKHLGDEWDFWWPVPVESIADSEEEEP